jgi:hypothetical protein
MRGVAQVITEQQRARDEAEKRVAALHRRMDHLERARREEEAPLLEAAFARKARAAPARPLPAALTAPALGPLETPMNTE